MHGIDKQAESLYNKVYEQVKKTESNSVSSISALNYVNDNYRPLTKHKSMTARQSAFNYDESTNFIEVSLGKPGLDAQGEVTTENFWRNGVKGSIKGDMEHYYEFKSEGLKVEDNPEYEGWVVHLNDSWYDQGELKGKVSYPIDHPYTETFLNRWKQGELGVSVDYETVDEVQYDDNLNPVLDTGDIYRFTFTSKPAIDTKPKGL
jgi:hypothetical protein